jgi:hypothetical protein
MANKSLVLSRIYGNLSELKNANRELSKLRAKRVKKKRIRKAFPARFRLPKFWLRFAASDRYLILNGKT